LYQPTASKSLSLSLSLSGESTIYNAICSVAGGNSINPSSNLLLISQRHQLTLKLYSGFPPSSSSESHRILLSVMRNRSTSSRRNGILSSFSRNEKKLPREAHRVQRACKAFHDYHARGRSQTRSQTLVKIGTLTRNSHEAPESPFR